MGASALAPCHLAKQNYPDIHYNLCQQKVNHAPISATIRPSARRRTLKFAFQPVMLQHSCGSIAKICRKDVEKCEKGDAGALRVGFSLILGLVSYRSPKENSIVGSKFMDIPNGNSR